MPGFIKTKSDEKKWSKAKKAAVKSGHPKNYAYVTSIYKNIKKGKAKNGKTSKHK